MRTLRCISGIDLARGERRWRLELRRYVVNFGALRRIYTRAWRGRMLLFDC